MIHSRKSIKIRDLGRVVTGSTPSTKRQEYYGSEYLFVKPSDITLGGRHVIRTETLLSELGYENQQNRLLPKHATCIVCIGTIGKMCLTSQPCFTNQQINSVIVDEQRFDPLYVYYLLSTYIPTVKKLEGGSASGREHVNKSTFENIAIEVHDLSAQRKIAAILSEYDDLIENNTRRIKILEEMAQAIYREWFVNFRFPGYENVPVVDSPLGPIPEGWEVLPVKNVLDHHIGGGWGKEVEMDQFRVPAFVIRGTDIPAARHASMDNVPFRYHTASNLKSRRLSDGDIVFEVSGGSKGQPVGRALLIKQSLLNDFDADVICASFCKLMRPKTEMIDSYYLYQHLQQIYEDGRIDQYQVQSTGITNFKFSHFLEGELLLLPSVSIRDQFANLSRPISDMILNLGLRNRNLRQTRDLLLPRLISGEMDVSDLDINVGEEVA